MHLGPSYSCLLSPSSHPTETYLGCLSYHLNPHSITDLSVPVRTTEAEVGEMGCLVIVLVASERGSSCISLGWFLNWHVNWYELGKEGQFGNSVIS